MLFLVNTTREIEAGEEILISYGKRTFQGTYLTVYGFTVDPKLNDVGKVDQVIVTNFKTYLEDLKTTFSNTTLLPRYYIGGR